MAGSMPARAGTGARPLLMVDVDGVISLFPLATADAGAGLAAAPHTPARGSLHSIDGIPHLLSSRAGEHLLALAGAFDLVWASGWEEKANEHLPHLLGLPGPLPYLSFDRSPGRSNAHWKLGAIDAYAGDRPLAWIDDALNEACHEWAHARASPTMLVETMPHIGLTELEARRLTRWARTLASDTIAPDA